MTISEEQIQEMEEQTAKLEREIFEKQKELTQLRNILKAVKGDVVTYPWTEKAKTCIENFNEFCSTHEILNCLFFDNKDELADPRKKRSYLVGLSVALSNLCNTGRLFKVVYTGVKGHFYGLIEWTNEGTLIEEYEQKLRAKTGKSSSKKNKLVMS